jgi:lipoate synthase
MDVLKMAKEYAPPGTLTKTSIMLGCGETLEQVISTMEKVRAAGVDVITFGQYMRPSKRHMPVSEYVTPEAFDKYRVLGERNGMPICPNSFNFHVTPKIYSQPHSYVASYTWVTYYLTGTKFQIYRKQKDS